MKERKNSSEEWREAIATLPDDVFFSLIRMYLGEFKTPYNKHALITELEAFLVRKETQDAVVLLLSDTDRQILAAALHIPRCTFEALTSLFDKTIPYAVLHEAALNLEERLILYRRRDPESKQMVLAVAPAFEDMVRANAPLSALFPLPVIAKPPDKDAAQNPLKPSLLAAFFAYITAHPDLCKMNGEFKKRTVQQLRELFASHWTEPASGWPGTEYMLGQALHGWAVLGLFRRDDMENAQFRPDFASWYAFADLPHRERLVWLAAAMGEYDPGDTLRDYGELLASITAALPETGLTYSGLLRLGMLKCGLFFEPRNYRDWSAANYRGDYFYRQNTYVLKELLESAMVCGLFGLAGQTAEGDVVYARYRGDSGEEGEPKALTMDVGFSITLFPGLPLSTLARLIPFLDLTRYDTAASYQITRKSCIRGFDSGYTPETMLTLLESACTHPLPQNLGGSLEDWYHTYGSVLLHHGYVLSVAEDRRAQFERNPALSKKIKKVLAPGVYFCDFDNDAEAARLMEKYLSVTLGKTIDADVLECAMSGGDIGESALFAFDPAVRDSGIKEPTVALEPPTDEARERFRKTLFDRLTELHLDEEQHRELASRIERGFILSPEQLRPGTVRSEKTEAGGIDFLGKLHFIERAISKRELLEFGLLEPGLQDSGAGRDGTPQIRRVVGVPAWLTRRADDSVVTVVIEPSKITEQYGVGRLRYVKKIRPSIFKELYHG